MSFNPLSWTPQELLAKNADARRKVLIERVPLDHPDIPERLRSTDPANQNAWRFRPSSHPEECGWIVRRSSKRPTFVAAVEDHVDLFGEAWVCTGRSLDGAILQALVNA